MSLLFVDTNWAAPSTGLPMRDSGVSTLDIDRGITYIPAPPIPQLIFGPPGFCRHLLTELSKKLVKIVAVVFNFICVGLTKVCCTVYPVTHFSFISTFSLNQGQVPSGVWASKLSRRS